MVTVSAHSNTKLKWVEDKGREWNYDAFNYCTLEKIVAKPKIDAQKSCFYGQKITKKVTQKKKKKWKFSCKFHLKQNCQNLALPSDY